MTPYDFTSPASAETLLELFGNEPDSTYVSGPYKWYRLKRVHGYVLCPESDGIARGLEEVSAKEVKAHDYDDEPKKRSKK